MTNEIQNLLIPIAKGQDLSLEQAERAFQIIIAGGATPAQMAAFLMGLRQKGESVDEITGGAIVLRRKAPHLLAPQGAIDTCGTGGDAKGTLNISTAVALVAAACGVPVAKHGNRSITSASGSADVLAALGVNVNAEIPLLEECLKQCGICFIMAPNFHTALRHVNPVRLELGLRTIFNLLGPLINPAQVKRQLLGVYAKEWVKPMAEVLRNLGSEHAWVVHGSDGLDELTLSGSSHVAELKNGEIRTFDISPEDAGLERAPLDSIKGQDPLYNAEAIRRLLADKAGPYRDIVLLNAAAALVVAGKVANIREGVELARAEIHWHKAQTTLAELVRISNQINV